ncbi:hypothetical protein B0H63DRAFT_92461 [Podospora didyma]|uniref:Uncharacterized protein n=1 Tax=Podospora didyma TaxID=330526 RepID=A0AAE0JYZ1_9PEZI|nr:hypothetical protein B0H63DRAFT_92461 [Podospora didyma]
MLSMFVSDSAMVLHLEAGTCESGADSNFVTATALIYFQQGKYTCNNDSGFDFKCRICRTCTATSLDDVTGQRAFRDPKVVSTQRDPANERRVETRWGARWCERMQQH